MHDGEKCYKDNEASEQRSKVAVGSLLVVVFKH